MTFQFNEAEMVELIQALRGAERNHLFSAVSGTYQSAPDAPIESSGSLTAHTDISFALPSAFTNGLSDASEADILAAYRHMLDHALTEDVMPELMHQPADYLSIEDGQVNISFTNKTEISHERTVHPNEYTASIDAQLSDGFNTLNGAAVTEAVNSGMRFASIQDQLGECNVGESYAECRDAVLRQNNLPVPGNARERE